MIIHFHDDVICPIYKPLLDDWHRYNVIYGGASSGKSVFQAQRTVLRTLEFAGYNSMIVRKINATNHESTFPEIEKCIYDWGVEKAFKINRSKGAEEITCINGNKMIFKGLDDVMKRKSITFKTGPLVHVWLEEATEALFEDYMQLRLRMRGKAKLKKQMTLTFNPISALHWAKKHFFDIPLPEDKCTVIKTTYLDNPYLDQDDRDEIERMKIEEPDYYDIYALGNWGIIGEIVFHNYVIEDFNIKPEVLQNVSYGMDFGFNHASTLIGMGWHDGELYIFDEVYLKKRTNPEFIETVSSLGAKYRGSDIIADSAEPDRIKEWKKAGFRVKPAKKGPGTLKMGIDFLKSKRIHIHKTKCPNTANEIQIFQHKKDKDGNVTDEFIEIFDDCIAAMRYGTEYLWGSYRPKILINERFV